MTVAPLPVDPDSGGAWAGFLGMLRSADTTSPRAPTTSSCSPCCSRHHCCSPAAIAVSILVSAAHAVRPLFPGREAIVAGLFGLVHGMAFSFTLAELDLSTPS